MFFAEFHEARRHLRSLTPTKANGRPCYYCGAAMTWSGFPGSRNLLRGTIDHRVPVSRRGADDWSNLVYCCFACNQNKAWLTDEEFVDWTGGTCTGATGLRSDFLMDLFYERRPHVAFKFAQLREILTRRCDVPFIAHGARPLSPPPRVIASAL